MNTTNGHRPTFAHELAAFRTRLGLSQSWLAHQAGYDHSFISRLEAGKREPSRDTVLALGYVLKLDTASLDRLLLSAGFRPLDDGNIFADEPVIADVAGLLRDQRLPVATRVNLREVLVLIVKQWTATIGSDRSTQ